MGRHPVRGWTDHARMLRRRSTEAERKAWRFLRNRGVLGLEFRRQHRIGPLVVDFYCAELWLVLELDGGYHESGEQRLRDAARDQVLRSYGVRVLRLANADVNEANLIIVLRPSVPLSA